MNLRLSEKRADGSTWILWHLGQVGIKDAALGFSISFLKDLFLVTIANYTSELISPVVYCKVPFGPILVLPLCQIIQAKWFMSLLCRRHTDIITPVKLLFGFWDGSKVSTASQIKENVTVHPSHLQHPLKPVCVLHGRVVEAMRASLRSSIWTFLSSTWTPLVTLNWIFEVWTKLLPTGSLNFGTCCLRRCSFYVTS